MLDNGSEVTLVEQRIADKLGLQGDECALSLATIQSKGQPQMSKHVNFEISSMSMGSSFKINSIFTMPQLNLPC